MKKAAYLGWAIGSFTSAAMVSVIGLLHLRYMTDNLGMAIGIAGTITVIAKLFDAATDPLMGIISDRTRTRWGKYRPYILAGGLLAGVALIALFTVPDFIRGGGIVAYMLVGKLLFSVAYTMYRIPYLAIGRGITQNFDERSKLMTFSVYGSSLGSIAATAAAPFMLAEIGADLAGHALIALILAVVVWIGTIITFSLLTEKQEAVTNPNAPAPNVPLRDSWKALMSNKPFGCLIGFKVTIFAGMAVQMNALPYYTRHVLHVSDKTLASIFLAQSVAMMASQVLWVALARRYGRRNALLVAAGLVCVKMIGWSLIPAENPNFWVVVLGVIGGTASGGIFLGLYTILTDTMDYSRRTYGENQAGIFAGVFVMVEKGTSAFGTFIFAMFMAMFGFVSGSAAGAAQQPDGVKLGIILALSLVPSVLTFLACAFMWRYHIPEAPAESPDAPTVEKAV